MTRKLASIQVVSKIEPIPGADRVELLTVQGYKLMTQKGQFKEGDLCVFFEVDSILPERPEFEFMRTHKFRVKVMKSPRLGVISQGLAMPIKDLTFKAKDKVKDEDVWIPLITLSHCIPQTESLVGCDITEILGVTKWEPFVEMDAMGLAKGGFPSFIPKTDEKRLQSYMGCLEEFKDETVYITQKNDGTSNTIYQLLEYIDAGEEPIVTDHFGVCSRNQELKDGDNGYWQVAHKYDLSVRFREFCKKMNASYAIQGELCGEKYGHGNPLNLSRNDLFVFNVYNITEHRYLDYEEFIEATRWLGVKTVPILFEGNLSEIKNFEDFKIEVLEEFAKGKYPGTENPREGIVIRPVKEKFSKTLMGRLSVKVINPDFSLKYER